jgi:lipopolysaccharide transport system permease protein
MRYRRTAFGPLWHVFTLSLWGAGVGLVYARLFDQAMGFFLPYLMIGFVLWGAISSSLVDAGYAFINSEGYIKQFARPAQVFVLRYWLANLLTLAMGLGVFLLFAVLTDRPFGVGTLWVFPALLLFMAILLAHSSILANLTVFARDFPHLMSGALQVLFFVTPIIFTTEMLAKRGLAFVYQFNPLWYMLEVVRYPLMYAASPPADIWAICIAYLLFAVALAALVESVCAPRLVYEL